MKSYCCIICFLIFFFVSSSFSKDNEKLDISILNNTTNLFSNEPINFNFVRVGNSKSKFFYIENAGTNTYSIQRIFFQNGGLGVFLFASNPKVPTNIQPGESLNISLIFQPNRIGSFFDTLLIYFNEPFDFVYSLPVEGHSIAYNLIFGKDTSDFIGKNIFKIPFYIKGDPNLVVPININLSFSLTTNAKVYYIDSINNGTVINFSTNGHYITYFVNINNFALDSSQKTLFYTIGKLFLSEQDTTNITISGVSCNENGIFFETSPLKVHTYGICVSNLSLINLNSEYFEVIIPNQIVSENLTIVFETESTPEKFAKIKLYNILGKQAFETELKIQKEFTLPLLNISSGLYKVEITTDYQKYSKIISVIK
ncbi:MAG: T9SS type A sorting domain-containing protein [Candidatus Kapaibacteriota bacterium]